MSDTISEQLFHQFHQCEFLLHRRRSRFHANSGMARHSQGRLLALLNRMSGASQKELADILGIRPPSLCELVRKLERTGHVSRQPNEQDRRVMDIAITPEGREFILEAEKERADAATAMFAGLNQEEQEQLSGLLGKLIAVLEEEDRAGGEDDPEGFHAHEHGHEHGPHRHGRSRGSGGRGGHGFHGHGPDEDGPHDHGPDGHGPHGPGREANGHGPHDSGMEHHGPGGRGPGQPGGRPGGRRGS